MFSTFPKSYDQKISQSLPVHGALGGRNHLKKLKGEGTERME
jgi:hypothetical protein